MERSHFYALFLNKSSLKAHCIEHFSSSRTIRFPYPIFTTTRKQRHRCNMQTLTPKIPVRIYFYEWPYADGTKTRAHILVTISKLNKFRFRKMGHSVNKHAPRLNASTQVVQWNIGQGNSFKFTRWIKHTTPKWFAFLRTLEKLVSIHGATWKVLH